MVCHMFQYEVIYHGVMSVISHGVLSKLLRFVPQEKTAGSNRELKFQQSDKAQVGQKLFQLF